MARRTLLLAALAASACLALLAAGTASAASLVAPRAACPEASVASAAGEEATMLCLTNFARAQSGEPTLEEAPTLAASAAEKSADILRCDSFSHNACGREFTYWIRANGYLASECWHVGENLAWGSGSFGSVRSIFRAWLRSPEHRANILGEFTQVGIDRAVGSLDGETGVDVWTQHFGSHCEAPTS